MSIRNLVTSRDFVEALGPELANAESVTIEIAANSIVRVTARFALDEETGDRLAAKLKTYSLIEDACSS